MSDRNATGSAPFSWYPGLSSAKLWFAFSGFATFGALYSTVPVIELSLLFIGAFCAGFGGSQWRNESKGGEE